MKVFMMNRHTMKPQHIHSQYDPNRLLNALMERLHLQSDRELSQRLNISFKLLGKIRCGDVQLSPSMLMWMAECAKASIDELRYVLGDRRAKARLNHAIAA